MKVGFIGAGNMATGLARGWKRAEGEPGAPERMLFADADPAKASAAADEVGGEALEGNRALAEAADLVVLAVKPSVLEQVAPELEGSDGPVVSILAGTTLEQLQAALPGLQVVRVMPNLGAQLRHGVFCVVYPGDVDAELRDRVDDMLGLLGDVIELDEDLIDPATALMGCGPGYVALLAEAMVQEGVRLGLSEEQAKRMMARSIGATGGLLREQDPATLKEAVASPGGMTEAGLATLEERHVRDALHHAVEASLEVVRR